MVIAIVAILASLLLPALGTAKEKGRQVKCGSNARQLGLGVLLYIDDHERFFPPSTDYSIPTEIPERIWTPVLARYVGDPRYLICPNAAPTGAATNWASRGAASIGYSTAAAYDPKGVEGFTTPARESDMARPSAAPLFGDTPNGPVAEKYRGYIFDPYNGKANPDDPELGTPLISDRDLVKELAHLEPARLKPMYARHMAKGNDSGRAVVLFGDGHVGIYRASVILAQRAENDLRWRFRPWPPALD